jgi:hypothetical protein
MVRARSPLAGSQSVSNYVPMTERGVVGSVLPNL